jgi:hypothetical protein
MSGKNNWDRSGYAFNSARMRRKIRSESTFAGLCSVMSAKERGFAPEGSGGESRAQATVEFTSPTTTTQSG